jgi:hypothetical protein
MKKALIYLWQLPQNLLGLLLILFYQPEKKHVLPNGNIVYYAFKMQGGISLGKYSFVNVCHYRKDMGESLARNIVRHEAIGHAKQSLYLGWLYLLIIGLPSIIWAWMYGNMIKPTKNGYYRFYTERWADYLGGIVRK